MVVKVEVVVVKEGGGGEERKKKKSMCLSHLSTKTGFYLNQIRAGHRNNVVAMGLQAELKLYSTF